MMKDKKHLQRNEIYLLLKILIEHMKRAGHVPDVGDHEACEEQSDLEVNTCFKMEIPAEIAVM